jgi:hypothetical protein
VSLQQRSPAFADCVYEAPTRTLRCTSSDEAKEWKDKNARFDVNSSIVGTDKSGGSGKKIFFFKNYFCRLVGQGGVSDCGRRTHRRVQRDVRVCIVENFVYPKLNSC